MLVNILSAVVVWPMGNNIMGILAEGSDIGANMVILSVMAHCIVPSL